MTGCPDWKRLAQAREADASPFSRGESDRSPEWLEALEHLDTGCSSCRREALTAEPLLVFRRLPVLDLDADEESREIDSMQRAVAAMRTASRLEGPARTAFAWRRWSAAAVLALIGLTAGPWRVPGAGPGLTGLAGSTPAIRSAVLGESLAFAPATRPGVLSASGPDSMNPGDTLEAVENRPDARVYQMNGDGISVTMIVDESLDV